jgi:hypothetical protein
VLLPLQQKVQGVQGAHQPIQVHQFVDRRASRKDPLGLARPPTRPPPHLKMRLVANHLPAGPLDHRLKQGGRAHCHENCARLTARQSAKQSSPSALQTSRFRLLK